MLKMSPASRTFNVLIIFVLSTVGLVCILPMIHIFAVSLSQNAAVAAYKVTFWPIGFNLMAYETSLSSNGFLLAFMVSIERALLGSAISMFLTVTAAYSMSKNNHVFRGRTVYAWFFVFTMLFGGGLIPTYLVVKNTGLIDSIFALILPSAVNVFNVVVMMNFFRTIPKDLEESAYIDGAGHFRILFRIYFPLSMPSFATLTLFSLVGHWNSWFDGMIYMTQAQNYPLATLLRALIASFDYTKIGMNPSVLKFLSERALKAAQIFIGTIPILLVYPFLQKYFIQGMTLGALKE
jgi:putative aldouronate transport system permease protein